MNKIDLIIDALEGYFDDRPLGLDKMHQALIAARELKELKPVGVFEYDAESQFWRELHPNYKGVKLYALNEVKHD
jgi:hypothetical protein